MVKELLNTDSWLEGEGLNLAQTRAVRQIAPKTSYDSVSLEILRRKILICIQLDSYFTVYLKLTDLSLAYL